MIKVLSSKIVGWLLNAGTVSQEDKELYEYAAYSFLFSMMPLCLVIIIGSVFGIPVESIFMILPFMLIRKFSGGFHLKSSKLCFFLSTILLIAALALVKYAIAVDISEEFLVIATLSAIQIFACSTVDSKERALCEKERAVFGKIAKISVIIFLTIGFLLYVLGMVRFAIPMWMGIIITELLRLPCVYKIKSHRH